ADAQAMGLVHQALHQLIGAKVRVDLQVIAVVELVIGTGLKNGVEVDGVDAEIHQVVQAIQNALQVAPHKVVQSGRGAPRHASRGVVGRVAVAKPLRKDVVEDGVMDPAGSLKRFHAQLQPPFAGESSNG